MPASSAVRVEGLRELNRAFARADRKLKKELTGSLREAAEPVRAAAEHRAATEIRNIGEGDPWSLMRTGVTTKVVYVAPKQRGARGRGGRRRPNLAGLLMDRAMAPALAANREQVVHRVDGLLGSIGRDWERL